jgi:signal transduction histidine kinase
MVFNNYLKEVSPNNILDSVLSAPKIKQQLDKVSLVCDVDQTCRYFSNDELLGVILNQLIDNALSFRNPDVVHKTYVSISAAEGLMKIAVIDNGIGIPADERKALNDIGNTTEEGTDTSVSGMHIVKSAVAKLGGDIDVFSLEGSITQVTVTLPNKAA